MDSNLSLLPQKILLNRFNTPALFVKTELTADCNLRKECYLLNHFGWNLTFHKNFLECPYLIGRGIALVYNIFHCNY